MRIAVTYDNGNIFQHFGKTERFKLYDVQESNINHSEIIDTNGKGHGQLAGFLKDLGVEVLICGGIGAGAQSALNEAGIKFFAGVNGEADNAVKNFINGALIYNPEPHCGHNHEHHHEHHECKE